MECILKSSPKLGEPTLEVRVEDKLVCTMPYEEEEDRVCEVKCPKGGGVCGIGATPILLPLFLSQLILHKQLPYCMHSHFTGTDARRVRPLSIGMSQQNVQLIKDAL